MRIPATGKVCQRDWRRNTDDEFLKRFPLLPCNFPGGKQSGAGPSKGRPDCCFSCSRSDAIWPNVYNQNVGSMVRLIARLVPGMKQPGLGPSHLAGQHRCHDAVPQRVRLRTPAATMSHSSKTAAAKRWKGQLVDTCRQSSVNAAAPSLDR